MSTPENKMQGSLSFLHAIFNRRSRSVLIIVFFCLQLSADVFAQDSSLASFSKYISLNTAGIPVCENFNTLAISGMSSELPYGWYLYETGTDADQLYTAGNGSSSKGDTYSFGMTDSSDRALGSHLSGNLRASWGVKIFNNTGVTLNSIKISFTGETWRIGADRRYDQIDFQYSTTADSLGSVSGWINADALDYVNEGKPRRGTGRLLHSELLSFTLTKLTIPDQGFFWLKWTDLDILGHDDGMGIDDFCITPISPCLAADALEFIQQPEDVVQDSVMSTVRIRAYCSTDGYTDLGYSGNVSLQLSNNGCGYISQSVTAVKGIISFDDIRISRSVQNGLTFIASASGLRIDTSQLFNVIQPLEGVRPLPVVNAGDDFDGCNGGPNYLNSNVVNAIGEVSYSWTPIDLLNDPLSAAPIASNTAPQTFTLNITDADGCTSSDSVRVNILSGPPGVWTGAVDQDWFNCRNWADGKVPSNITDVTISAGIHPPVISGSSAVVRNIVFNKGARLFMPNSISQLTVFGNFVNNSGSDLDSQIDTGSTVIFKGDTAQFIGGEDITTFQRLVIENNQAEVELGQNINIVNQLLLRQSTNFVLGDFDITLKSFPTITANVGIIPEKAKFNYNGKGRCIVERYINTGVGLGRHGKGWQLLATPIVLDTGSNQTIRQAWQEGAETTISSPVIDNPRPGYGTLITTNLGGNNEGARRLGFDVYTRPGPSIKFWNGVTQSWQGPPSTDAAVANGNGYIIFVRGDRSVTTYNAPANPTTMRVRGKLHQPGIYAPQNIFINKEGFHSVGNPYASAIDFSKLNKTEGISENFYVFDPTLKGTYGVGGYQTIVAAMGYTPTPGNLNDTSTLYFSNRDYRDIQSGQAFFVYSLNNSAQSIAFSESAKVAGSRLANKPLSSGLSMISTSLFVDLDGKYVLADGNRVIFDNRFSNKVDGYDALKMLNGGENFGIVRNGCLLAVESRQEVTQTDTVFFSMSGLQQMKYELVIIPSNMDSEFITAELADDYLRIFITVSMQDTVRIPFSVNSDPQSKAASRFKLILNKLDPLPAEIIDITAIRNAVNHVSISWKLGSELNVDCYEVERSSDGRTFEKIHAELPVYNNGGAAYYNFIDECPLSNISFYRIKAVSKSGRMSYSHIVRVEDKVSGPFISIYPVPINGGRLQVSLQNQHAGDHAVKLFNSAGQLMYNNSWKLFEGNNTRFIDIDKRYAPGVYHLEILSAEGNIQTANVIVE